MNEREFDKVLSDLRRTPVPPCPTGFENGVLRRVRAERAQSLTGGTWADVVSLALRPRMAAAMIAFAASFGAVTTAVASQVAAPVEKRPDTLGLEMISNPHVLECHHVNHGSRRGHAHQR